MQTIRPAAPPGTSTLLVAIILFACAGLSVVIGKGEGVFDGKLIDTDSYARVSRIEAMLEAGRILAHTPRDNSGLNIALHWSHVLDALIVLLALPLRLFLPLHEALHLAGAAIGPVSTVLVALAAYQAVRLVAGNGRYATSAAVLAAVAPGIVSYGAFGRADHHVALAAIAVMCPALAYAAGAAGRGMTPAIAAGALGALGEWISPEALPFVLLAWGVAALRDVEAGRRVGPRALSLAGGHLAVLGLALVVDPPVAGRLALEVDRLSLPYVELGAGMLVVPLILRRLVPAVASPWRASIVTGAILAAPLVAWVAHYPGVLKGAGGIFSAEAIERVWRYVAEMQPVSTLDSLGLMIALPALVLAVCLGALLWRTRTPLALLLAGFAAFLLYIGLKHIRFSMYAQLAAVVALCAAIEFVTRREPARAMRLGLFAAWLGLLLGPFVLYALLPSRADAGRNAGSCDPRPLARDLEPLAGQIVLTPFSDAPAVLYFTRVTTVAGPYHRAERLILRSMDAFDETTLAGRSPPASFLATKAKAVLVCTKDRAQAGTLWAALKEGRPPDWLVERPLASQSGYRLYVPR